MERYYIELWWRTTRQEIPAETLCYLAITQKVGTQKLYNFLEDYTHRNFIYKLKMIVWIENVSPASNMTILIYILGYFWLINFSREKLLSFQKGGPPFRSWACLDLSWPIGTDDSNLKAWKRDTAEWSVRPKTHAAGTCYQTDCDFDYDSSHSEKMNLNSTWLAWSKRREFSDPCLLGSVHGSL